MIDTLLFAESLLAWMAANYAFGLDPVCDDPDGEYAFLLRTRWSALVLVRSVGTALVLSLAGPSDHLRLLVATFILLGSILVPWIRRCCIPVCNLMEFELVANGAAALVFWFAAGRRLSVESGISLFALDKDQISAVCLSAALLIFMIHGGNFLVRGILKKAGGLPGDDQSGRESDQGFAHGRMIGQVERIVVVLIVVAGSLSGLAFFFAAKGLIRSKELDDRRHADYLLLGSLASFLIALSAGLILQRVYVLLWK